MLKILDALLGSGFLTLRDPCSFIKSPTSISVTGISELGNNASDSLNTCSSLGISYISVKLLKIDT